MSTWNLSEMKHHVLICNGSSCMRMQGEQVTGAIRAEIAKFGAEDRIHTTRTRCNGRCEDGCVVIVYPEGVWYRQVTPEIVPTLVERHLLQGGPLDGSITYRYDGSTLVPTGLGVQGKMRADRLQQ